MAYISDDEKHLMEDLLNRALDAEANSSADVYMIKKQADRIVAYRLEQERKLAEYRSNEADKNTSVAKQAQVTAVQPLTYKDVGEVQLLAAPEEDPDRIPF